MKRFVISIYLIQYFINLKLKVNILLNVLSKYSQQIIVELLMNNSSIKEKRNMKQYLELVTATSSSQAAASSEIDTSIEKTLSQLSIINEVSANETVMNNNISIIHTNEELLHSSSKGACLDGKYFTINVSKCKTTTGTIVAVCQNCNPLKEIKGSIRTTSNFTTHLKRKHAAAYKEYLKYAIEKRKGSKSTINKKRFSCYFDQETFEQNIVNFILKFMVPFHAVEDSSFRKIFDNFQIKIGSSQLKHLTRYTIMKKVDNIFKKMQDKIKLEIGLLINEGGFVCTTADVWTGGSRRYLGVTAHWVNVKAIKYK
ncbi:uncharacterized protein [Prorops nasuta]|uniref:uncharacterized protein n=1 Tax=Prorops nasuta TaxID=863751 RepID=UPI0034CFD2AF